MREAILHVTHGGTLNSNGTLNSHRRRTRGQATTCAVLHHRASRRKMLHVQHPLVLATATGIVAQLPAEMMPSQCFPNGLRRPS
eukprot:8681056-Alexandrium_andersonii.AAC.1